jgi:hypothetical protein
MAKHKKPIRVVERKLGKNKCVGVFWPHRNLVEIDPRQSSKEYLNTLVHELLHAACPEMTEEGVIRVANLVARHLWKQKYRKILE